MTPLGFVAVAALLVVLALAALLPPLLARPRGPAGAPPADDETAGSNLRILREQLADLDAERAAGTIDPAQHAAARAELERRVLDEAQAAPATAPPARGGRAGAVVVALLLPVIALALYLRLGNRDALDPPVAAAPPPQVSAADVEAMVERLAQRMREQPGDPDGWIMLGRSYAVLGKYEAARDAFQQALQRRPDDAGLLADTADALAMTQDQRVAGEPERLALKALQIEPDNLKALALAGTAALERGDAAAAVPLWERARRVAPPDSPIAAGLEDSLREARLMAGIAPPAAGDAGSAAAGLSSAAASASGAGGAAAAAGADAVTVRVSLAPALAAQVRPDDTLFVFARAAEGPRMPLAIARRRAAELPLTLTLDDSMAMMPALRLSAFPRVVIGARLSRSGQAEPQPGDLEGEAAAPATTPGADSPQVAVEIGRVRR